MLVKSDHIKIFNILAVDANLFYYYRPPGKKLMTEEMLKKQFEEDAPKIIQLKKYIKRWINKANTSYINFSNLYILIRNVFKLDGISFIAFEYFTYEHEVFQVFCSLAYHFDGIKISNCMNNEFLDWLENSGKKN